MGKKTNLDKLKELIIENIKNDEIEEMKASIKEVEILQQNSKFFKEILNTATAISRTIKFAESEDREIDIVSLANILTGVLVILEKKDFIKIIRSDEENE